MTAASPPRALRVLLLPDRLVLHDITFELRNRDPSDRNSLIDATNSVHSRAISASVASAAEAATPNLIDFDLPTPPSATWCVMLSGQSTSGNHKGTRPCLE